MGRFQRRPQYSDGEIFRCLCLHSKRLRVPVGIAAPKARAGHEGRVGLLCVRLEGELIEAAAERSRNLSAAIPSRAKLAAWIAAMPEVEKNALLLGMAEDNDPRSRIDLLRRFNQYRLPPMPRGEGEDSQPR